MPYPSKHVEHFRKFALKRFGRCQWCNRKLDKKTYTADHLHPAGDGGSDSWSNLALSCQPCNGARGCTLPRALPYGPRDWGQVWYQEFGFKHSSTLHDKHDLILAPIDNPLPRCHNVLERQTETTGVTPMGAYATPAERAVWSKSFGSHFVSLVNSTGMFSRVEIMDPERAAADFAAQPEDRQRSLNPRRVLKYTKSAKAGKWVLHHQGLAYGTDGILVDGRHRLKVVIDTGLSLPFNVAYNVPPASLREVDGQRLRSKRDRLLMAGDGNFSHDQIATLTAFFYAPAPVGSELTDDDFLDLARTHGAGIDYACKLHFGTAGFTRSTRALIARAYFHVDRPRLDEFCKILHTGLPINLETDTAAISYRNYVIAHKGVGGRDMDVDKYEKGQYALSQFLEGKTIRNLRGVSQDLYPIKKEV